MWTAEAWGCDAFTPLTWIAAHTSRIRRGTGIAQMAARTPTATAMHALTLDHLSGGRMMLGLGLSGPQVVEGWYGRPFPKSPLTARKEEAVLAVPDTFADEISLVGPRERIAERLELWRKGPVTDLLVTAPDPHTLCVLADLNCA